MITPGRDDSQMFSSMHPEYNTKDYYGLGIIIIKYDGKTWLSHGGNHLGYSAMVTYCLDTGTIVAGMNNADMGKALYTIIEDFWFNIVLDPLFE
jgi:hypothetical protein